MMEPSEFRRVMGHFPTGVAVVTGRRADGTPCGLTVNAFCSVSLDPALVLVCIEHNSMSHGCIMDTGAFVVNVLEQTRGEGLARRFSTWGVGDKFHGIAYREESSGAPVLEDALAWIDCRVWNSYPGGDHTIFVGEVTAADAREGTPLVYYRGGYGRFIP
ncbi:flavin reductase family protein [soil metagenome]|jgi:flavin reductase (DIM6/NTAB) family NADH-FMN oxidoreductase RutF|nr:flavin reductase family protein [Gemmatimonadota bacterium]MDQ3605915.1 flavin reductase family protein [Gemmatimonadota bacterium]